MDNGPFPKPPDVPDFVQQPITYASGTNLNVLGDGSDDKGGIPPYYASELTDPYPVSEAGWDNTADNINSANFPLTVLDGGTGVQAKFRTQANVSHVLRDDPINAYGLPGQSHCHTFYGNGSTNAFSTYNSLRAHARLKSTAAGGPLNGTGYWNPCVLNSAGEVIKPNYITIYYVHAPEDALKVTRLPLGLRYVHGYNMADGGGVENMPAPSWLQDAIDAANAQAGTAGRYSFLRPNDGFNPVRSLWTCPGNGASSRAIRDTDGTDLLNNCPASSLIDLQFSGAQCWDGVNPWSPGGNKHVIPPIYDNHTDTFVCPMNWYRIPALQLSILFSHPGATGPDGYLNWKLAPEEMHGITDDTINSIVHNGVTVRRGEMFHNDWFNGWENNTLHNWHNECLGMDGTPHECNFSVTSRFQRLISTEPSPIGRPRQVDTAIIRDQTDPADRDRLARQSNGPDTLTIHDDAPLPVLMMEGDSISICGGNGGGEICTGQANYTYTEKFSLAHSEQEERTWAIAGSGINGIVANRLGPMVASKPSRGRWGASLLIGANDLFNYAGGPSAYISQLQTWASTVRNAGGKVILSTILPINTGVSEAASHNANRAVVNPALRQMLANGEIDALADYAADPIMGPDDSFTAYPSYWDGFLHPNGAGHARLETIYAAAVEEAFKLT